MATINSWEGGRSRESILSHHIASSLVGCCIRVHSWQRTPIADHDQQVHRYKCHNTRHVRICSAAKEFSLRQVQNFKGPPPPSQLVNDGVDKAARGAGAANIGRFDFVGLIADGVQHSTLEPVGEARQVEVAKHHGS